MQICWSNFVPITDSYATKNIKWTWWGGARRCRPTAGAAHHLAAGHRAVAPPLPRRLPARGALRLRAQNPRQPPRRRPLPRLAPALHPESTRRQRLCPIPQRRAPPGPPRPPPLPRRCCRPPPRLAAIISNEYRLNTSRRLTKNTVSARVPLILSPQCGTSQSEAELTGTSSITDGGGRSAAVLTFSCWQQSHLSAPGARPVLISWNCLIIVIHKPGTVPCQLDSRCLSRWTCHSTRIIVWPDPRPAIPSHRLRFPCRTTLCRPQIARKYPKKREDRTADDLHGGNATCVIGLSDFFLCAGRTWRSSERWPLPQFVSRSGRGVVHGAGRTQRLSSKTRKPWAARTRTVPSRSFPPSIFCTRYPGHLPVQHQVDGLPSRHPKGASIFHAMDTDQSWDAAVVAPNDIDDCSPYTRGCSRHRLFPILSPRYGDVCGSRGAPCRCCCCAARLAGSRRFGAEAQARTVVGRCAKVTLWILLNDTMATQYDKLSPECRARRLNVSQTVAQQEHFRGG